MKSSNFSFLAFWALLATLASSCADADFGNDNSVLSGSYSTMLTLGDRLYLVNQQELITYNIESKNAPYLIDRSNVGFDIESLFHYQGLLLIGSSRTMHIFQLDEQGIPQKESSTDYFASDNIVCVGDPIVMRQNLAYVTLADVSDNSICWGRLVNELRVYDMTNLNNPELLTIQPLPNPKGMALGLNNLYICDGRKGLFVMDINDPVNPVLKQHITGFEAFDAIVRDDLLIVSAKNQLIQFDISDENLISYIGRLDL